MEDVTDFAPAAVYEQPVDEEFLNPACVTALAAIRGNTAGKKRQAVLRIAFAQASGMTMRQILDGERTVARTTWYRCWRREPEVVAALEVLTSRALEWRSAETERVQRRATNEVRRTLARASIEAVQSLRALAIDPKQDVHVRMEASTSLLGMVEKVLGERLALAQHGTPIQLDEDLMDALIEQQLECIAFEREEARVLRAAEARVRERRGG